MMVLSGTDSTFTDADGNYTFSTDENFRKVLEAFKRLKDEGVVHNIDEWTPDWQRAFADENFVSYLQGSWFAISAYMPSYAPEQAGKWAVTQWPSLIGENGGSEGGGDIYVIPTFVKNEAAAKEVLEYWFLRKEGTIINAKMANTPPVLKSALDDPRVNEPDPYFGETFMPELLKSIESYKLFRWDPAAAQELSIASPYFDKAINGQMGIDEALAAAESDMKNQIGNPYQR